MKLLVTDVDDTLSRGETVSDEVIDGCRRLCAHGWEIMLATGRSYSSASGHIRQIGAIDTAVVYDGARVMRGGHELLSWELTHDEALEILDAAWNLPLEIQIAGDELILCREKDVDTREFCEFTGMRCNLIDSPRLTENVFRVGFWGDREIIKQVKTDFSRKFGERFAVTLGGEQFLDVLSLGVSKGHALDAYINKCMKLKPELIVAAGDHLNDLELLKFADVAAVPSDGVPDAVELADIVIPSVSEHGMRYLTELLLKEY